MKAASSLPQTGPAGLGNRDLYVSFRVDSVWTEPVNLGSPINSETWSICPSVPSDGKYLLFTRRTGWPATGDSDIFRVDAGVIDRLRLAVHLQ
jgi:hypothetical protein